MATVEIRIGLSAYASQKSTCQKEATLKMVCQGDEKKEDRA